MDFAIGILLLSGLGLACWFIARAISGMIGLTIGFLEIANNILRKCSLEELFNINKEEKEV